MSITVRNYSKEDLITIQNGTDKFLSTVFMNGHTFSTEEIKVYPYDRRKTYLVEFELPLHSIIVYATDDETLKQFLKKEYDYTSISHVQEELYSHRTVSLK